MPTSSEEIALIEQEAKFNAFKELLEIDIEEESASQTKYSIVASRLPKFEEHYLILKVAYKKYKRRIVPSVASEADFNHTASTYEYNDPWIKSITRDFVKLNDAVVTYLDTKPPSVPSDPGAEEKCNLASRAQVEKIISKIRLESSQVTESLDETYKRLGSLTQINTGQSQVYNNLKNELLAVLDDKIPCLIQSLIDVAGASDQIEVKKIEKEYVDLESQEKPRLYQLLQVIAEKTQDSHPTG